MYAQNAKQEIPVAATLNDRLNKVADELLHQCDRLESVLSRVNGTPHKGENISGAAVPIRPPHAMVQVVESLEGINQRLDELANGVSRIA